MVEEPLLKSALWYLNKWKANPVFVNIFKRPIGVRWGDYYMRSMTMKDVEKLYKRAKAIGKPAGIAIVPSPEYRLVVLDIDDRKPLSPDMILEIAKRYVVAVTPRGLRIIFKVNDEEWETIPERLVIYHSGEKIGEGASRHKHMWNVPPGAACLEDVDEGKGGRCSKLGKYKFLTGSGQLVNYPWLLKWEEPPLHEWELALDELYLTLEIEVKDAKTYKKTGPGGIRITSGGKPIVPIPCWEDLEDFKRWLEYEQYPPLPPCVAKALGYDSTGGRMVETGRLVRKGERFIYGASAVLFLSACIASFNPVELINFVGEHLEDFPHNPGGERLDKAFSRLLSESKHGIIPRYAGLGSIGGGIDPEENCKYCPYSGVCLAGVEVGGEGYSKPDSGFYSMRHWIAYSQAFWATIGPRRYGLY